MRLQELGHEIRRARIGRGLTQAQLATAARLSRTTLNQLENGLFPDLGVKKVLAILETLKLDLAVKPAAETRRPDFIRMACTRANVSYRIALTEDELIHALLAGKLPAGKRPHLRALLDEAAPELLNGLIDEASKWTRPERIRKNLGKIAHDIGATRRIANWLKTA
jgi:transcriptional regulator with XRE-family HTH domain